jgi:predicted  nucleic acid-binding Zn-ribbon protein
MARQIKGISVRIDAETKGLNAALKDVRSESNKIGRELYKVNRGLRFSPKSTELLSQKQDLLKNRIESTKKELSALKQSQDEIEKKFKKGEIDDKQYREFKRDIVQAESKLDTFNSQLKETNRQARNAKFGLDNLKKAGRALATGMAAAGAAIASAGYVIGREINKTMNYADEVDKLSQKIGLTAEATQEWSYIAEQNGTNIDNLSSGIQRFTRNVLNASEGGNQYTDILNDLNVELKDSNGNLRDMDDIFPETIKSLAEMETETERNAITMELFGRRGSELIPILNSGTDSIEDLQKKAEDLDLKMSDEDIQSWVDFKDEMATLNEQLKAAKRQLATEFLPFLQYQLAPFLQNDLIPKVTLLIDKISELAGLPFTWEGGDELRQEIMQIEELSEAEVRLAKKRQELEEMGPAAQYAMGSDKQRKEHVKQQTQLEDEISLLEYLIQNWNILKNTKSEAINGGEDGGDDSLSDEKSKLEEFNEELERMISNYEQEKEISSLDKPLDKEMKKLDIERQALLDRAEELEASEETKQAIRDLYSQKEEQAIRDAKDKALELEKEYRNELAIMKKEGLDKELEQLRQQEKVELEAAKGKEEAIDEIEEKYRIKRQEAREKYAEKEKELERDLIEWKYKNGFISTKYYRNYLQDRLKEYEMFSEKWKKIYGTLQALPESEKSQGNLLKDQVYGNLGKDNSGGKEEQVQSINWMTDAWVDLGLEIEDANQKFVDWKDDLVTGLSDAIARGEDLGDVFENIGDQIASMVMQKAIVGPIVDIALSGMSLPSFHEGGFVSPRTALENMQRFHTGGGYGLKSNEQPAILEYGERVLTEGQNKTLESMSPGGKTEIHNHINAIDTKSFAEYVSRNPEAIINVVGQDIMRNGNLRKAIKKS